MCSLNLLWLAPGRIQLSCAGSSAFLTRTTHQDTNAPNRFRPRSRRNVQITATGFWATGSSATQEFQDLPKIPTRTPAKFFPNGYGGQGRARGEQAAVFGEVRCPIDRWYVVSGRRQYDRRAMRDREWL